MNSEKYTQMRRISALGLSVYDTILFLDSHDCPEAREYLDKRYEEYILAVESYEAKYGPITWKGHPSCDVQWAWQLD